MGGQEVSGAMGKKYEEKEHLEVGCLHLAQVSDRALGVLRDGYSSLDLGQRWHMACAQACDSGCLMWVWGPTPTVLSVKLPSVSLAVAY